MGGSKEGRDSALEVSLSLNFHLVLIVDTEQTVGSNNLKPTCEIFLDL